MANDYDPIAEIERLDRFFDGDEEGERPIEVLRNRGISIPDERELDDDALHAKLWEIINGMSAVGMVVESTNHLSDRDLYRYLVTDAMQEETILPMPGGGGRWHVSPIGSGSEEDNEIYLRYYADDEIRKQWQDDFGCTLPAKEKPPFDRDRLLPVNDFLPDEEIQ
ncbi:MAG: hypothetical protein QOC81_1056 [Thermoanaerobaculia bacterium]|jgi:hypothetical protein|nr:hypothetical protein [Thermoanaerobaculia bacterium]